MKSGSFGVASAHILIAINIIGVAQLNSAAQQRSRFLPNPALTPGATLKVSKEDLCGPTQKELDSSISVAMKAKVFELYGIRTEATSPQNIDHLIPVSLGGSNAIENLWPQPLSGEWNYNRKNQLERRLHRLVCRGELDLATAQRAIASDWLAAYKKYAEGRRKQPKQD